MVKFEVIHDKVNLTGFGQEKPRLKRFKQEIKCLLNSQDYNPHQYVNFITKARFCTLNGKGM